MLKSPDAKYFTKKNDIHVFEDSAKMEFLAQKNDASCFMVGSHTKKRPQNLTIGRTFDGHVLDIMELGVENFKSIGEISAKSKKAIGSKPCFLFTGVEFEQDEQYKNLKSILLDTFRGTVCSQVNLAGLDHVICCVARNKRISFRVYTVHYYKSNTSNVNPNVELHLMGPCMDLSIRRSKLASSDLMKTACRKPKGYVLIFIKESYSIA